MSTISPENVKDVSSAMLEHMFYELETKMESKHNITSSSVRQRYLKQYFEMYRGMCISYDEGLIRGDAVLAAAVWRNVYKARANVDVRDLARIVAYLRAVLADFEGQTDEEVLGGVETLVFGRATKTAILGSWM